MKTFKRIAQIYGVPLLISLGVVAGLEKLLAGQAIDGVSILGATAFGFYGYCLMPKGFYELLQESHPGKSVVLLNPSASEVFRENPEDVIILKAEETVVYWH